jgi:hypothetical protein
MNVRPRSLVLFLGSLCAAGVTVDRVTAAGPAAIGIDFVGLGTAMGTTELAGVVTRRNWNNATGSNSSTLLALVDEFGAASGATVTWTSEDVRKMSITDQPGNYRLMRGFVVATGTRSVRVVVSGLTASTYDVYVYADGANLSATRSATYSISGAGITTTSINLTDAPNKNYSGTFVRAQNSAGNYVKFTISGTAFTLTAVPGSASSSPTVAPVNGIQIVPVAQTPTDTTPPTITATSPANGTTGVTPTTLVRATFNEPMLASTITSGTVTLQKGAAGVAATVGYDTGTRTATLTPTAPLQYGTTYSATVVGGSSGVRDAAGNPLATTYTWTFATGPAPTFGLSGVLTPLDAGAGATVGLGGAAAASTVADASGAYSFSGLLAGSYVVIPSKTGYTFSPSTSTVTITSASLMGVNFSGSPAATTYAISGSVSPAFGGAGTTVALSGTASATTVVDSTGAFAFSGLAPGSYTVTPSKSGYSFTPADQTVSVTADVSGMTFAATAVGHTMTRANSYDDAWQSAWVTRGRSILTVPGKTDGFVLQIGDSITHSRAYSGWARAGQGRTADDLQVMNWARAAPWSTTQTDTTNKNGWYLTGADTTAQRGMTSSGGLTLAEFITGCCNGGPTMPAEPDGAFARQSIANATYTGNLQIDTLIAAFSDAQFAVLMLGTNDPQNPLRLVDLETIVNKLEAAGIVPILSTIPPRNDSFSNQLNIDFNIDVRTLAETRSLPLIDFYQEILLRQPGTTWINTLISSDGVHPTGAGAGYGVASDPYTPGGDPWTHTTGDAAANVGYLLRSWLTVQKLKEVKLHIVDGIDP